MTVINTNTASMTAQFHLSQVNKEMEQAMERLSSGQRVNSAADDAAGLTIASRMDAQIRGLGQAIRNANDGISMSSTAEGAMQEIESMLQRMREIAVQSSNGTYTATDRENLNNEVDQLKAEIDRVVNTTTFNGKNVLDGSFDASFQIGAFSGQTMDVNVANMSTTALGSVSGASAVAGTVEASFSGTEATATEAQISFNGNDTYSFTLAVVTEDGTTTMSIEGDVANNSAEDIVAKINEAMLDNASQDDVTDYVNVSYSGNVVTISNTYGGDIDVSGFSSDSGATASYSSIVGDTAGTATNDNSLLGNASPAGVGTSFAVSAEDPAVEYNDGSATEATAATVELTLATDAADADEITLTLSVDGEDDVTLSHTAATGALTSADIASALAGEAAGDNYTVATSADDDDVLVITRADGKNFSVAVTEDSNMTFTANDADTTDVGSADGSASVTSTDGVEATEAGDPSGGTRLYLALSGSDDYTFNISTADGADDDVAISFSYSGTEASRDAIATQIGAELGSDDYQVAHVEGRIEIIRLDGTAFDLESFTSAGAGKITASTETANAGDDGSSILLDDTTFAQAAGTDGAGSPVATEVEMSFTADDYYAFSISDGSATAFVTATSVDADGDMTDIEAAVNYALQRNNLDDVITVTADADNNKITLSHAAGKEVTIGNFESDSTGSMKVESANTARTSGFATFLDDGDADNMEVVSGVDVLSANSAQSAIDIIDRALEDVASERANLGAVVNRLDHTINNMSNVSTNTAAAKSGIVDADFAAETSQLAKTQILSQAATSMLAQANQSKQGILALLQG